MVRVAAEWLEVKVGTGYVPMLRRNASDVRVLHFLTGGILTLVGTAAHHHQGQQGRRS
jgi:hypothetical protein